MKMTKFVILLIGLCMISACSQSPLSQLTSNQLQSDLTPTFWQNLIKSDPEMWQQALSYCSSHSLKPNCALVIQTNVASIIHNGSTQLVPLNSNPIKPPTFE